MLRTVLKSKIHRATVTEANLDYMGSLTVDSHLLKEADILPFEQVQVYNITNGERFITYALEGAANSGIICVNGAAAHLAQPGHLILIVSYCQLSEQESYQPKIIMVNEKNQIVEIRKDAKPTA